MEGKGYEDVAMFAEARREAAREGGDEDVEMDILDDEENYTSNIAAAGLQSGLQYAPVGWKQPGPDAKHRLLCNHQA